MHKFTFNEHKLDNILFKKLNENNLFKILLLFFCFIISGSLQTADYKKRPISIKAIESNNIDDVIKEIRLGRDINSCYEDSDSNYFRGDTPLIVAIHFNRFDIVELFTSLKNTDINKKNFFGMTPLMKAAYLGRLKIVELLIKRKAKINLQFSDRNELMMAYTGEANKDIIKLLLNAGADYDQQDMTNESFKSLIYNPLNLFKHAIEKRKEILETFEEFIQNQRKLLPIPLEIIETNDIAAAKRAIEQGYQVNKKYIKWTHIKTRYAPISSAQNSTPLIISILLNKLEMVEFLISLGADVNMRDNGDKTPLWNLMLYFTYMSREIIDRKIFDLLLKHSSLDISQLHGGKTYLELAIIEELHCERSGEYFIVPKILEKIANSMNKKDYLAQISLVLQENILQRWCCSSNLVRLFLERGARIKFEKHLFRYENNFYGAQQIYQEFIDSKKNLINELLQCVQEKNDKRIEEILQNYPILIDEQNSMGETVLLNAILFGRFDLIKKFFDGDSIFIKPDLLTDHAQNGKFGPNNPVQNAIDLRRRVYDTATLDQIIDYLKSKRLDQQILVEVKKSIKLPEKAIELVTDYL